MTKFDIIFKFGSTSEVLETVNVSVLSPKGQTYLNECAGCSVDVESVDIPRKLAGGYLKQALRSGISVTSD